MSARRPALTVCHGNGDGNRTRLGHDHHVREVAFASRRTPATTAGHIVRALAVRAGVLLHDHPTGVSGLIGAVSTGGSSLPWQRFRLAHQGCVIAPRQSPHELGKW
jgi:hypothetical protein